MEWIVSDNIERESWRRLHEFANVDLTTDYLAARHGVPPNPSTERNYKKQAEQARVCVLQAKEYFDAARASTLFTSPNHLYYGLIALSSALRLLLGDGRSSLDYLRRDPANGHHGLRFTTGCSALAAKRGLTILEQSHAEILGAGHFLGWYSVLPRRVDLYGLHKTELKDGSVMDFRACGGYLVAAPADLVGRKRTALELLCHFPDLAQDFRRYGVAVSAARTTQEVRGHHSAPIRNVWTVHQLFQPDCREQLLERFQVAPRFADCLVPRVGPGGVVWAVEAIIPNVDGIEIRWPESRDTMDHETISYADPIDTHELVDAYIVAYQLSMLSRYYPDLWVACIESHCKAAKLIERTVDTLIKKTPVLTLSLLSPDGVTISTHRAPWK
jgi:hypothetical protein